MKVLRFLSMFSTVFVFFVTSQVLQAADRNDLIQGAKKEGVLEFYAPSTLTPQGAQALAAAFNKQFGLAIDLRYHPSGNMARDVSKLVGMAATGVAPEWDLMVVTDSHHASLWLRKLHNPYDYKKLGVDSASIHYDSSTVSFANQIVLPAYNQKFLAPKDLPTSWEDFLDPKWKGGKLGVSTATHHFARLAVGAWGEEKGTQYVRQLATQQLSLGRLAELYSRLLIGEISLAVTFTDSYINRAKKKGAPIVHLEGIQPIISPAYHAGVLKGSAHPNTGHLFSAFLTSDDAQAIWERYGGQSSAFIPGTTAYKFFQGKKAVFMTQNEAQDIDRLGREYGKMLGFGRRKRKK